MTCGKNVAQMIFDNAFVKVIIIILKCHWAFVGDV